MLHFIIRIFETNILDTCIQEAMYNFSTILRIAGRNMSLHKWLSKIYSNYVVRVACFIHNISSLSYSPFKDNCCFLCRFPGIGIIHTARKNVVSALVEKKTKRFKETLGLGIQINKTQLNKVNNWEIIFWSLLLLHKQQIVVYICVMSTFSQF